MELIRKQTYLTSTQDRALKDAAARQGTTESHVLREIVDAWMETEHVAKDEDPLRRLIGFVDVPVEEADHDDIYRQGPQGSL
jgi:hypothetical protein